MKGKDKQELKEVTSDKYLGLTGSIWCVIAGLCYGTMNVFAKLSYERGLEVSRFVLMRFFVLLTCSYTFGKVVRKTSFDLRKYNKKVVTMIFLRSAMSLVSKVM